MPAGAPLDGGSEPAASKPAARTTSRPRPEAIDVTKRQARTPGNRAPANHERGHAAIYQKVREVAATGAIPIILGGDHSITWPSASAIAEVRRPGSIGIVHFDAHADTAPDTWGQLAAHGSPMRRLIESGAVNGRNFVQIGLRGYWPPTSVLEWMHEHGLRWHLMTEIEARGAEA